MRSVFLWRMIFVIIVSVLLASLLMTGGYMYLSLDTYVTIKLSEMVPEANAIAQLYLEFHDKTIDGGTLTRITDTLMQSAISTRCLITDTAGTPLYQSANTDADAGVDAPAESLSSDAAHSRIQQALEGKTVEDDRFVMANGQPALAVCVPIQDDAGEIYGAVFLLKPFSEIRRTTNRLNNSLFMAALFVIPIILIVASMGARQVAEPLHRMSDVAIRMRDGDFNARADENHKGEVGLLARALNDLCDTLSQTIYQLRAEKSQLKEILASFSEGVAATDSVGCLTHYNDALKKMFGAVRVDTRSDLIPDMGIWDAYDEVSRTGKATSMRYPLPGDRMLWITISPVITEDGERTGVVGLFKDMTDVENLEKTRREYIANVSHEMRTPLTAIRGLLEPLADGLVTEEEDRQRYYKIMLREVNRLSRLITDMMQLSRLQAGTEYMELAEVDIEDILQDVLQNYTKEASQRGIELVLEIPEALPHVLTDADRVEQVLIILLDNAMRYSSKGGSITIRALNGERVNISVIDTGTGIPEADLPHIFERFYTVDKSRKEGGTGLGLSIAQQIINRLGEKIMVESKTGEGTAFTFTLKKYVINAIALGPAHEEWELPEEADQLPPLLKPHIIEGSTLDAEYEVLSDKTDKKESRADRKRGKGE